MNQIELKTTTNEDPSFMVRTFQMSYNEKEWHNHQEYELIFFTEGSGFALIGTHEEKFEAGDIYFLGCNLLHKFQGDNGIQPTAIIVLFHCNFLGDHFFNIPECRKMKELLVLSTCGLKIISNIYPQLQPLIKGLETSTGGNSIVLLLQCLQLIASTKEYNTLITQIIQNPDKKNQDCINRILKYTIDAFRDAVTLRKVAAVACMSVPSFCNYFKRQTQKTYINYLNEVRVGYACNQLATTDKPVTEIGYESGYNTVAHFHRQFLRLKKTTPLQYRKMQSER